MNTVTESLIKIFERDLQKLEEEITLYPSDESVWKISGDIKNSAGNLCLHLCGNLQYYIGAILGATDYKRNRELEFSAKGLAKKELITEIQRAKKVVITTLGKLDVFLLEREYPIQVFNYSMTTTFFMIHLASHLNYHLGQINYHRRLL
jgi:uncharacterized damage-inducible protein DinB